MAKGNLSRGGATSRRRHPALSPHMLYFVGVAIAPNSELSAALVTRRRGRSTFSDGLVTVIDVAAGDAATLRAFLTREPVRLVHIVGGQSGADGGQLRRVSELATECGISAVPVASSALAAMFNQPAHHAELAFPCRPCLMQIACGMFTRWLDEPERSVRASAILAAAHASHQPQPEWASCA